MPRTIIPPILQHRPGMAATCVVSTYQQRNGREVLTAAGMDATLRLQSVGSGRLAPTPFQRIRRFYVAGHRERQGSDRCDDPPKARSPQKVQQARGIRGETGDAVWRNVQ